MLGIIGQPLDHLYLWCRYRIAGMAVELMTRKLAGHAGQMGAKAISTQAAALQVTT